MSTQEHTTWKHNGAASNTIVSLLLQGDTVQFSAGGPSMHPAIRPGETVLVRPVCKGDLRPGAILLFPYHGRLVLHRLVRKSGTDGLLLAGDAAIEGTEHLEADCIIGVATTVYRRGTAIRLDTPLMRLRGRLLQQWRPIRRWLSRVRNAGKTA